MKTLIIGILFISQVGFAQSLPVIYAPIGFDEGTETRLSGVQVMELVPWANRSNEKLRQMLHNVSKLRNPWQIKQTLLSGIKSLILTQTPERTELMMRYVLNRGLKVFDEIDKYTSETTPGVIDLKIRILRLSALMAIDYYKDDLKYITGQNKIIQGPLNNSPPDTLVNLPFGSFAIEYSDFLMKFNESVTHAKAQYAIGLMALGLFQWDLYRDDLKKLQYAPAITKIYDFLRDKGQTPSAMDIVNVQEMRQIRNIYKETIQTLRSIDKSLAPVIDLLQAKYEKRK